MYYNSKKHYSHLGEAEDDDEEVETGNRAKYQEQSKTKSTKLTKLVAPPVVPPMPKQLAEKDKPEVRSSNRNSNGTESQSSVAADIHASVLLFGSHIDSTSADISASVSQLDNTGTDICTPGSRMNTTDDMQIESASESRVDNAGMSLANSISATTEALDTAVRIPHIEGRESEFRIRKQSSPALTGDANKHLVMVLMETKAAMNELQRQTQINTQLLQSLLNVKGDHDTVLEGLGLPASDIVELTEVEHHLKSDKAIFTKLVRFLCQHYIVR
jgi:hypothetical protein